MEKERRERRVKFSSKHNNKRNLRKKMGKKLHSEATETVEEVEKIIAKRAKEIY